MLIYIITSGIYRTQLVTDQWRRGKDQDEFIEIAYDWIGVKANATEIINKVTNNNDVWKNLNCSQYVIKLSESGLLWTKSSTTLLAPSSRVD